MKDAEFLSGFIGPTSAERKLLSAARAGEECVLSTTTPPLAEPAVAEAAAEVERSADASDALAAALDAAAASEPVSDGGDDDGSNDEDYGGGDDQDDGDDRADYGANFYGSDAIADLAAEVAADLSLGSEAAFGVSSEAPDDGVTIRAEFLRALITGENGPRIHESGLRLRGARITGVLNLAGCDIRHILGFRRCRFDSPVVLTQAQARSIAFDGSEMPGFYGDRIETTGSLYLRADGADAPFRASDSVSLVSARIGGDLRLRGGHFSYDGKLASHMAALTGAKRERLDEYDTAISLHKASVRGTLDLREAVLESGALDLALAKLHTLRVFEEDIERELGPTGEAKGAKSGKKLGDKLILDGLVYSHMPIGLAGDAATLKRFLLLQIDEHLGVARFPDWRESHQTLEADVGLTKLRKIFLSQNKLRPQPFEHLVRVLRDMGYEDVAREISVFKQRRRRFARGEFSGFGSMIHWLFGLSAGFGYRPLRAVTWLVVLWLVGAAVAFGAYRAGGVVEKAEAATVEGAAPRFEALVYSADLLVPFVILHQEDSWAPDPSKPAGLALHYYAIAQVVLGWILSALAIAGVTGLVQRN